MATTTIAVVPCPSCKTPPRLYLDAHGTKWRVMCSNPDCRMVIMTEPVSEVEEALAIWNTAIGQLATRQS